MVRWRNCLILALLLLLPVWTKSDEDPDDDDEDDNDEELEQVRGLGVVRRAPVMMPTLQQSTTTTEARPPLECYVCSYKTDSNSVSCLDPTKYRVHTMTCQNEDDKCFVTVTGGGLVGNYDSVVRGCRSSCTGTPETTCCTTERCNNIALAQAVSPRRRSISTLRQATSKSTKSIPPTVLFFVTILLVLQTVVKVALV